MPISHNSGDWIVRSLFVVPDARGVGLSKLLLCHACMIAKDSKVPQLFSLVFDHRESSARAHISAGFKMIGTLQIRTCFGTSDTSSLPGKN